MSSAQLPVIQTEVSRLSVTQCRRGRTSHELDLEGTFNVRNVSTEPILVARNVDMVLSAMAGTSMQEVKDRHYTFEMEQVFGGCENAPTPRFEQFAAVKPGESASITMGIVLPATTDPKQTGTARLRPGKYWVQLEFSTLPLSCSRNDLYAWSTQWKTKGRLLTDNFITEPFPLDVVLDPKAPSCDSDSPIGRKPK